MKNITLLDVIEAKQAAEFKIKVAIEKFTNETGLRVLGFKYSTTEDIHGKKIMGFEGLDIPVDDYYNKA